MEFFVLLVAFVGIIQGTLRRDGEDVICTPGKTFKIDCNYCFCIPDGNYACTKMACEDWNNYEELNNEDNDIQPYLYKKRESKSKIFRKKRAADKFDNDEQFFVDEDPAPLSFEQQQELARQNYLQQQQDYYDRVRLQQDLAQEREQLQQEQEDLEQQQDEMHSQLEFQQDQDAQQREEDARQMALERQLFVEQQQRQIELQQQQKQDGQYYKKARNFARKTPLKNIYPE